MKYTLIAASLLLSTQAMAHLDLKLNQENDLLLIEKTNTLESRPTSLEPFKNKLRSYLSVQVNDRFKIGLNSFKPGYATVAKRQNILPEGQLNTMDKQGGLKRRSYGIEFKMAFD